MIPQQLQIISNDGTGQFQFAGHSVRFALVDSEPWFASNDCGKALSMKNVRVILAEFPEDEKRIVAMKDSIGRSQKTLVISFPGLLRMIFQSRKAEAEAFKRFVYHDVLPAIQKTGKFEMAGLPAPEPDPTLTLADTLEAQGKAQQAARELLYEAYGRHDEAFRRPDRYTKDDLTGIELEVAKLRADYDLAVWTWNRTYGLCRKLAAHIKLPPISAKANNFYLELMRTTKEEAAKYPSNFQLLEYEY